MAAAGVKIIGDWTVSPRCRQLPEYCMNVGRALVTPTRIVSLPPETELSNRILRRYQ